MESLVTIVSVAVTSAQVRRLLTIVVTGPSVFT